jgi:predicted dehydrogenase
VALVGAGHIAGSWVSACAASEHASLVAIVDVDLHKATKLAGQTTGCKAYGSVGEFLDQLEDTDAVIVATPPSTHCELVEKFAGAGLHVLCEKPLCIDLDSAYRMSHAATRNDVLLTMASKFRFVPDVERAKELVDSGVLGDLQLFENAFTARVDMRDRWNSQPAVSGGGVLIDNGTHSLDITRYFLGPITHVQVIEGPRVQGLEVEETVHIALLTQTGVMGTIDLSWSLQKVTPYYVSIYGSKGVLTLGWQGSQYTLHDSNEPVVIGPGYQKTLAFTRQLDNFIAALRGDEPLRITIADAIGSVGVVDSAYRAMKRGEWEPIPQLTSLQAG